MLPGSRSEAMSTTVYFEGVEVAQNNDSFQYLVSTGEKKKRKKRAIKERNIEDLSTSEA